MMQEAKKDLITKLRQDILLMEGFKPAQGGKEPDIELGAIKEAFPNGIFPTGAIHEFVNLQTEHAAASGGFIAGLLKTLMQQGNIALWVSAVRKLFPPALKSFGVDPERIIFVDLLRERDVLWVMEEGLRCEGFAAVVAEVQEINFAESRRLQLAVEKSKVTGFVIRHNPLKLSTTACVARWQITPLPSILKDGLPGVGYPRWQVELMKVRNGLPGIWQVEWQPGGFAVTQEDAQINLNQHRKVG